MVRDPLCSSTAVSRDARARGRGLSRRRRRGRTPLRRLLATADVRFVNLESTLSEQGGETGSPHNQLVFTGPPAGAAALGRAGIDVVSLANNHAWDYGRDALLETMDHLDRAGIAYVGAGRTRQDAYGPRVVARAGFRVAFVAVTDIWNQGFDPHPGKELVADASEESLLAAVRAARALRAVDAVLVSYHGGEEYLAEPRERQERLLRAAIDAGADVVLGHHPHVVQRVDFYRGKPIFYSLGNLLMRMKTGEPWTEFGMLARLVLGRGGAAVSVEICPFRIFGLDPVPLAADPKRRPYEALFRFKYGLLLRGPAAARMGELGADGCARLLPPG
ncbi:MAG: CapA family protein [Deltaproteobacteria bacterium]|nr:CapA family protein [Deltaproteobacteria bacterium]